MPAQSLRTTTHRRLVVALTAVITALVAGAVALAMHGRSQPEYAGHRWVLVRVVHDGEEQPLPEGRQASMSYRPNHSFTLHDTVNYSDGAFTPSGSGYTVSDVNVTGMAYGGSDPRVHLLEVAMNPLSTVGADRADVSEGRLVLRAGTYVFTFDDAGAVNPT